MARIHHATAKRAAKLSITLLHEGDVIVASKDGTELARGASAAAVLAAAELILNPKTARAARKSPAKPKKAKKSKRARKSRDDEEGDEEGEGDQEGAEDGDEEDEGASVVKRVYKQKYRPHRQTSGDGLCQQISANLRVVNAETGEDYLCPKMLREFAVLNGVWQGKYSHLNVGMRRMNIANRLRAALRKNKDYKVKWPR